MSVNIGPFISDDLRALAKPFSTFRRRAEEAQGLSGVGPIVRGPAKVLAVIAAAVSFTTAGQLTWDHLIFGPLSWSFVPLFQLAALLAVARVFRVRAPAAQLSHLYFAGHGPWLCLLLLFSAVCLFAPEAWPIFEWMFETRLLPALLLGAVLWCGVLTFATFRAGLGLTRKRSLGATALFYFLFISALLTYFGLTGQLVTFTDRLG